MKTECEAVFLFIAELTGSFVAGSGKVSDKIKCGSKDYVAGTLHELDLECEEDRKDLHENMWLERLYNELDEYFNLENPTSTLRALTLSAENYREETYRWNVPIELDASALMLAH